MRFACILSFDKTLTSTKPDSLVFLVDSIMISLINIRPLLKFVHEMGDTSLQPFLMKLVSLFCDQIIAHANVKLQVARNNAKSTIDDLEYKLKHSKDECLALKTELNLVHDSLAEVQADRQRHIEDKRELKTALSESQAHQVELEHALSDERRLRREEITEWEQFQTDLLMTVRVANDFKTEAQSELERVVMENKAQRDKLRALEAQLDKLNKGKRVETTALGSK